VTQNEYRAIASVTPLHALTPTATPGALWAIPGPLRRERGFLLQSRRNFRRSRPFHRSGLTRTNAAVALFELAGVGLFVAVAVQRMLSKGIATSSLLLAFIVALAVSLPLQALRAQTVTPEAQEAPRAAEVRPYRGTFDTIRRDIDAFWSETFTAARLAYQPPAIVFLDRIVATACGPKAPEDNALYCLTDRTIYLNPQFLSQHEARFGDYAPIIVLAHEWGHHIQNLLQVGNRGGNGYELQADCLAGVYTRNAEAEGLLEPGDLIEALAISEAAGDDPLVFPQDAPGAHGTYIDRRNAVMRGYLDGPAGCNLPLLPQLPLLSTPVASIASTPPPPP
jgi:predicted metalloprotease